MRGAVYARYCPISDPHDLRDGRGTSKYGNSRKEWEKITVYDVWLPARHMCATATPQDVLWGQLSSFLEVLFNGVGAAAGGGGSFVADMTGGGRRLASDGVEHSSGAQATGSHTQGAMATKNELEVAMEDRVYVVLEGHLGFVFSKHRNKSWFLTPSTSFFGNQTHRGSTFLIYWASTHSAISLL